MIKFKIDHYEDMEFKKHWFWTVENPEIPGPHYTRKNDCKRGLNRFIRAIHMLNFTIEEVNENQSYH